MRRTKTIITIFIVGIVISISLMDCGDAIQQEQPTLKNDTLPLTKHWEIAIPHLEIPEGLVSISAENCGTCHKAHYEEWKISTHALAWQDLQFQAEWGKEKIFACINCHIPLQDQQEYIITGLINGDYKTPAKKLNPHFDKKLQLESITCATCHVRDGAVIGTGLIGNTKAPHKTKVDVDFLSEQVCIGCHNVVDQLSEVLVCTFETGDEWKDNWAYKTGKNCVSCHMPIIERELFPGFPKRKTHFHSFPGSGIPKYFGAEVVGLNGLEITEDSLKNNYQIGEKLNYKLRLKNSYAGHSVPTGDPERFFMIDFKLLDADSNILATEQYRIGEHWEWYPVAKLLEDTNLKPLEEREFEFEYELTETKNLILQVEITRHRMTEKNAKYNNIFEDYPIQMLVFEKGYEVTFNNK